VTSGAEEEHDIGAPHLIDRLPNAVFNSTLYRTWQLIFWTHIRPKLLNFLIN